MTAPSRPETRAELVRLLQGVDLYRDWRIAGWRAAHGPDAQFDPNEFVEPGAVTLAQFDAYDGPHDDQFLRDVQTWYSVTATELGYLLKRGDTAVKTAVETFLADFERTTGTGFFANSGLLKKTATRVLKRGHIAGEDEWHLIKDLLDATDLDILPAGDHTRLAQLHHDFEARP